jgi:ribonuclease Z
MTGPRAAAALALTSIVAVVFVAGAALGGSAQPQPSRGVELVLLGTGMPVPDPKAWGPASAVVVDGSRVFVVDAGAGVTRQLAAAGFPRIKSVEATFITHLHSDHTMGYPDLIFTTWIMGRRAPLVVYGPPGLRRFTSMLLDAWREDIDVRVKGLERENAEWLPVDAREVDPGVIYDRDDVRVTAIRVPHGMWPEALAFRFDARGRSITFAGDTAPSEALVAAAKGTDILVHEAYIGKRAAPEDRPGGEVWPQYLREYHTSDVELGKIAARIQPKLLVLHHVLRMGGTDEELLAGIRAGGYQGRVVVGRDLERY